MDNFIYKSGKWIWDAPNGVFKIIKDAKGNFKLYRNEYFLHAFSDIDYAFTVAGLIDMDSV